MKKFIKVFRKQETKEIKSLEKLTVFLLKLYAFAGSDYILEILAELKSKRNRTKAKDLINTGNLYFIEIPSLLKRHSEVYLKDIPGFYDTFMICCHYPDAVGISPLMKKLPELSDKKQTGIIKKIVKKSQSQRFFDKKNIEKYSSDEITKIIIRLGQIYQV